MRIVVTALFAMAIGSLCMAAGTAEAGTNSFIVPQDQQAILKVGAWTPSQKQAKEAMAAVQRYLKGEQSAKPDPKGYAVPDAEKKILERGGTFYCVQFLGADVKGKRMIRYQFFPVPKGDLDWKTKEYRYGKDGGVSYWGILYDPDKNECLDFWTHGEA
jgi:hypothetical protein